MTLLAAPKTRPMKPPRDTPLSRRTPMIRRGAPPHRAVIWENWEALDNIRRGRIKHNTYGLCVRG
jgi:hypothetical protein